MNPILKIQAIMKQYLDFYIFFLKQEKAKRGK